MSYLYLYQVLSICSFYLSSPENPGNLETLAKEIRCALRDYNDVTPDTAAAGSLFAWCQLFFVSYPGTAKIACQPVSVLAQFDAGIA